MPCGLSLEEVPRPRHLDTDCKAIPCPLLVPLRPVPSQQAETLSKYEPDPATPSPKPESGFPSSLRQTPKLSLRDLGPAPLWHPSPLVLLWVPPAAPSARSRPPQLHPEGRLHPTEASALSHPTGAHPKHPHSENGTPVTPPAPFPHSAFAPGTVSFSDITFPSAGSLPPHWDMSSMGAGTALPSGSGPCGR